MASKGVAAVLNVFFWGAGYVYLGRKKTLGGGLMLVMLLLHLPLLYGGLEWYLKTPGLYELIGHAVLSFTLAYDVLK